MNIQISVVIWTVICFSVLMLILRNWLFRPVLKILDERREKLSEARALEEEYAQMAREQKEALERQRIEYEREHQEQIKLTVARIKEDEKTNLKQARVDCLDRIDDFRRTLEADHERIIDSVSPKMEEAARIFAEKIVSR